MGIDVREHLYPILIAIGSSTDNFTVGVTIGLKTKSTVISTDENNSTVDGKSSESNKTKTGKELLKHDENCIPWFQFNGLIAFFNAIGAWTAGKGGLYALNQLSHFFSNSSTEEESNYPNEESTIASLLAALAFLYLAMEEFKSYFLSGSTMNEDMNHEPSPKKKHSSSVLTKKHAIELAIPMSLNNLAGGVAGGTIGVSAEYSFIMAFVFSFLMMDAGYRLTRNTAIRRDVQFLKGVDCSLVSGFVFSILASSQVLDYFYNDQ